MEANGLWLYFLPPVWFSGLYELVLTRRNDLLMSLGVFAGKAMAIVMLILFVTWVFGFRRHYRRTLEAEEAVSRTGRWNYPIWLARVPEERALFDFTGKTLARSQKHQFFLATYTSIGLSVGLLFAVAIRGGKIVLSLDGVRLFAYIIVFFVISGLRAVFQFPAALASNWLFRLTEARWIETSRSATRKRVLVSGLLPAVLLVLPFEAVSWDCWTILEHCAFQLMAGTLLVELMFWNFDKVPFTCSYFPGRTNLSILAALYLYGFTAYSSNMADLERAIERRFVGVLLFFAATAALLRLSWLRHPVASPVRFDGEEPIIQTLDLM